MMQTTATIIDVLEREFEFRVTHVIRTEDDDFNYFIAGGGEVKTAIGIGTEDTLANLETILSSPDFTHIAPGNFQYIDLRFGNKVYIKEHADDPEPVVDVETEGETG